MARRKKGAAAGSPFFIDGAVTLNRLLRVQNQAKLPKAKRRSLRTCHGLAPLHGRTSDLEYPHSLGRQPNQRRQPPRCPIGQGQGAALPNNEVARNVQTQSGAA